MKEDIALRWPVDSRRINQGFNQNPDFYRPFGLPGHEGLDLFAPTNATIYAAADGEVYESGHPNDHPYGLHIRIRHTQGNVTYRTIYAHLQSVMVSVGQQVTAGQQIGLANNTGNSFGSHLHFTMKIDGEQTEGYPKGIVDPLPYLQRSSGTTAPPPPQQESDLTALEPSDLLVRTTTQVNLRTRPTTSSDIETLLAVAELLTVLGDAADAKQRIGQAGQWVPVVTANGTRGYAFASLLVEQSSDLPEASDVVVYPTAILNLRAAPQRGAAILLELPIEEALIVLGDGEAARAVIGDSAAWLHVQTAEGVTGHVSAGFVRMTGQTATETQLTVFATNLLVIRARPKTFSNRLTIVTTTDPLTVLGDGEAARALLGQDDGWINVKTPSGHVGYASSKFLQSSDSVSFGAEESAIALLELKTVRETAVRTMASPNAPVVTTLPSDTVLDALEPDQAATSANLGHADRWIFVMLLDGTRGWVNAAEVEGS